LSDWAVVGSAIEVWPGLFEFTDDFAGHSVQRFYGIRSP